MKRTEQILSMIKPSTMIAMLGDLTENIEQKYDSAEVDSIISTVAEALFANVGYDAIMLLSEANISHEMIDCEFAMWQDEQEESEITL